MMNSEPQPKESTLASLGTLYPEAFAIATAADSHAGLALRAGIVRLNFPHSCSDQSLDGFSAE